MFSLILPHIYVSKCDDAKRNIFFLMLNAGHPVCRSPIPFNQIVVDKRYWQRYLSIVGSSLFKIHMSLHLSENYLSIIKNFEQRRRLSKLRISAHKLQIEIGRYQGTLQENPICCRCTSGQVEDEIHYLLHCTCHTNHREIFTTYLTSECQNFQNLDDKCKLIWILNNEDPTILSAVFPESTLVSSYFYL
jgi:hypothetical protein